MGKKKPSEGSASVAMAAATHAALAGQTDGPADGRAFTAAELFGLLDANGDGALSRAEVVASAYTLGLTPKEASALFDELDTDGDGALVLAELAELEEEDEDGAEDDQVVPPAAAETATPTAVGRRPAGRGSAGEEPPGSRSAAARGELPGDLTASEREALRAAVASVQRELSLLSETDVWLQVSSHAACPFSPPLPPRIYRNSRVCK